MAAGEALAYLNEYWIERRVGFDYPEEEEEVVQNIVEKLSELAKDGSKKIRCVEFLVMGVWVALCKRGTWCELGVMQLQEFSYAEVDRHSRVILVFCGFAARRNGSSSGVRSVRSSVPLPRASPPMR